jgi:phosphoribosylglycinamide formyltransferase-1
MRKRLAVFISNGGSGSNVQAIIDAVQQRRLDAEIVVVISDVGDAEGLQKAKNAKIVTHVFDSKKEDLEKLFEPSTSLRQKKKYVVDYIVLAGWKKIIPEDFIVLFRNKILNIHPGLIPDSLTGTVTNPDGTKALWNRGKFTTKAIQQVLDNKVTFAGSSVHFLTEEFDFGPVLGRCFEKIRPTDTVESLYQRLKKKEHQLLVQSLQTL